MEEHNVLCDIDSYHQFIHKSTSHVGCECICLSNLSCVEYKLD